MRISDTEEEDSSQFVLKSMNTMEQKDNRKSKQQISQTMSVAEQLKCKIHPTEYFTNFCIKPSCNQELCATCICEHTQYHNRTHTKPEYQNIKDTFLKTNENLNSFKDSLAKEKSRVKNIMDAIEKKRKEVQKVFKQAKEDVLSLVERTFNDLEKEFNDSLLREKQKTGLLNEGRLDEIYSQINKKSLEVYSTTQELNNMRQINNIKKVNSEFLPRGIEYRESIAQELTLNQKFQATLNYKSSNLDEVSAAIKRLISVSFSYSIKNQPISMPSPALNTNQRVSINYLGETKTPLKDVSHHHVRPSQIVINPSSVNRTPKQSNSLHNSIRPSQIAQLLTRGSVNLAKSPPKAEPITRKLDGRMNTMKENSWFEERRLYGNTS